MSPKGKPKYAMILIGIDSSEVVSKPIALGRFGSDSKDVDAEKLLDLVAQGMKMTSVDMIKLFNPTLVVMELKTLRMI